ncbi:unnamed protein product [Arctogadus glacialis]
MTSSPEEVLVSAPLRPPRGEPQLLHDLITRDGPDLQEENPSSFMTSSPEKVLVSAPLRPPRGEPHHLNDLIRTCGGASDRGFDHPGNIPPDPRVDLKDRTRGTGSSSTVSDVFAGTGTTQTRTRQNERVAGRPRKFLGSEDGPEFVDDPPGPPAP